MKVGDRVMIENGHPLQGHTGEIVRLERIGHLYDEVPVVRLDDDPDGQECFIEGNHIRVLRYNPACGTLEPHDHSQCAAFDSMIP